VLEARQEPADAGHGADGPIAAGRDTDQHAGECAEQCRGDSTEQNLNRPRTVPEQDEPMHCGPSFVRTSEA
jgi:hypothetical protein